MIDNRYRILADGKLEIVDPRWEDLPVLRALNPTYEVPTAPLMGFVKPLFLKTRAIGTGLGGNELSEREGEFLWSVHERALNSNEPCVSDEASLLDLKIEIAKRMMKNCALCARNCGVNRLAGDAGWCGNGVVMDNVFTHVAEEAEINPSITLPIRNCGLSCVHCQMYAHRGNLSLAATAWERLDTRARSLQFWNPEAAALDILVWLQTAPDDVSLPIVLNTHAYLMPDFIRLFERIADVWLPDFKFGNDQCGMDIAGVPDYPAIAFISIEQMLEQEVPVICRLLILPGHNECCHLPALNLLASVASNNLIISVMEQYSPDHRITTEDGPLARRPSPSESNEVRAYARSLGLRFVAGDR